MILKCLLSISVVILLPLSGLGQQLYLQKTRFIGANPPSGGSITTGCLSKDGGIVFVGNGVKNGNGDIPSFHNAGETDILIGKMDANFNIKWTKLFGTSADNEYPVDICALSDGGFAIVIETNGIHGDMHTAKPGAPNYWVVKVDSVGSIAWKNNYGGLGGDTPYDIESTADGGLVIASVTTPPAVNNPKSPENPKNAANAINAHVHIYNTQDKVQGELANVVDGEIYGRSYDKGGKTQNVEIDVSKEYKGSTTDAHSVDHDKPEVIQKNIDSGKIPSIK